MPAPSIVAAAVLAAGSSTRMGRNKLLLDLGGETMVRRVVRAAAGAGLDQVVVVLGHDDLARVLRYLCTGRESRPTPDVQLFTNVQLIAAPPEKL